jgi:hypothetical protein
MARDDEGDRIPAERPSHSPGQAGSAQSGGKVGVGNSLSHRNFAGGLTNLSDKRTHFVQVHRDVAKVLENTIKVITHPLTDISNL